MPVVLLDESVLQRQTPNGPNTMSIADPAFSESLLVTVKADVLFGRRPQGSGTATRNKLWDGNGGLDESQQQRFLNLLNQDPAIKSKKLFPPLVCELTVAHLKMVRKFLHMCYGCMQQERAISRTKCTMHGIVKLTVIAGWEITLHAFRGLFPR